MKDRLNYEWDVETLDKHGDVYDHDFEDRLAPLLQRNKINSNNVLVLVASWGNDDNGVTDRAWAYVQADGTLPNTFDNGHPVPKRFHDELRKAMS